MDFNTLSSREKWNSYKAQFKLGHFVCPECSTEDKPKRCSPIPGCTLHCSKCDSSLSARTGGGQCDPFWWVFVESLDTGNLKV